MKKVKVKVLMVSGALLVLPMFAARADIASTTYVQGAIDSLAPVAKSGSAADLIDMPEIPTQADVDKAVEDSANALTSATAAAQDAADALSAATTAGTAASDALTAATTAGTNATSALTAATAAETAATAAETAATAAQTAVAAKANTADLGSAAFAEATTFATSAQGAKADAALQAPAGCTGQDCAVIKLADGSYSWQVIATNYVAPLAP